MGYFLPGWISVGVFPPALASPKEDAVGSRRGGSALTSGVRGGGAQRLCGAGRRGFSGAAAPQKLYKISQGQRKANFPVTVPFRA